MNILFKLATRSRPAKCFSTLDNIIENCASPDYKILLSIDEDDRTMNTISVLSRLLGEYDESKLFLSVGNSKSKIEAVNEGINVFKEHWDIICVHSDDMVFLKQGFDNFIREQFTDFSGLLHLPDGHANERLCTYPLMDKAYYDVDRFVYHQTFTSVYADNFAQDLAISRGRYKFVDNQIFEHRHPAWGFDGKDELMKRNESKLLYKRDKAVYEYLKKKYKL